MRQLFIVALGLAVVLALILPMIMDQKANTEPHERVIYGMTFSEVESVIGRPPDHPLDTPGANGFFGMQLVASTAATWEPDLVVFFDADGGANFVMHGKKGFGGSQPRKTLCQRALDWVLGRKDIEVR